MAPSGAKPQQAEFLTLEYTQLWAAKEAINQRQLKLGQVYLTTVGGLFAGILAVHKLAPGLNVLGVALVASLMIGFFGTYVYVVAVNSLFSFVFYVRAINNIRRYFKNLHPEHGHYFSLPTSKTPSMRSFSFHCALCSVFNAFFFSVTAVMCVLAFSRSGTAISGASILAVLVFAFVLVANHRVFLVVRRARLGRSLKRVPLI